MTEQPVKNALAECRAAVLKSLEHLAVDDAALDKFVAAFEEDFRDVLCPADPTTGERNCANAEQIWKNDRHRVTTLARAMGTLAEFLALADKRTRIEYVHLKRAHVHLSPVCHARGTDGRKEYCVKAQP